ncbi:hypothetical protein DP20_3731 [Shigella flexneri]|nr:hypothetical protein DP20_3731 [Shigella flexneri]
MLHSKPWQSGNGMQFMRFAERQVGFVTSLPGRHVTMRHAEITDIAMPLVIEPLHQNLDCPFVVITDRSKAFCVTRQQNQR